MSLKRADVIRGVFLLAVGLFFGYRYVQLGGVFYVVAGLAGAGLGLASLPGWVPKRWQTIGLNAGVTLFFLDLVFAEINLREVGAALARANYWMLVPSTALILVHLYFRSRRWQWLLKPLGEVSFWPAFRGLVIGITGNFVLPARAGEFLRAYVLGRATGLAKTGVFATLVIERIFDGLTVLLVLLAVIALGFHNELLQTAGLFAAIFYLGAIVAVVVFLTQRHLADGLIQRFLPGAWAAWILGLMDGFGSGLEVVRNPRQLAMVAWLNVWTWVPIPLSMWFALLAFDFGVAVPWQAPLLTFPAMALSLTIPGTPGGVGAVHAGVALALNITFAGMPVAADFAEVVAAASIVIHLSQFVPEVIPGIISFAIEGLSAEDVRAGRSMGDTQTAPMQPTE